MDTCPRFLRLGDGYVHLFLGRDSCTEELSVVRIVHEGKESRAINFGTM